MRAPVSRGAMPLVALFVVLAASPRVFAQDDDANQARVEFSAGVQAFEGEHYDVALRHFLAAWQIRPHPTVRVNLASCFAKLGRVAPAVLHYRAYLADRTVQLSRAARREVQQSLAELEPRVGTVEVDLSPPDARLTVDGQEPEARDGSRLYLLVGTHRIAASAPGHGEVTRVIDIAPRSVQSLDFELPESAPTPPPPREPEETPAPEPTPTEDLEPVATDTEEGLPAPEVEAPEDEQPVGHRSGSGRAAVRWSFYGVAGLAVVSATVLGVMALGAYDDFDAGATRIEQHDYADTAERARIDAAARDDADRASTLALWTDVSIGVAVAAAATGTVIWLTTPSPATENEEATRSLRIAGTPMPHGGAVALSGTF